MPPPASVVELVERFDSNLAAYRSGGYNEAQLRQEFLNPLFEALGWDVYNKKGYAEAYKEVIHEAAVKVGGRTKAPDYCFRAGGGVRGFFVEAKKPSVDIALRNAALSQRDLNFAVQRTIDLASEGSSLLPNTGLTPLTNGKMVSKY